MKKQCLSGPHLKGVVMSNESVYRYVDKASSDGFGGAYTRLYLHEYPVIKETREGIWIDRYGKKKFILLSARKKFACFSKEEALESFIARKERQIDILESRLSQAKDATARAKIIKMSNLAGYKD